MLLQDTFMNIANLLFCMGTILLVCKVYKNKNSLKDFDFEGSLLTFLGSLSMFIVLWIMNVNIALILSIPTIIFWGLVSWYSRK